MAKTLNRKKLIRDMPILRSLLEPLGLVAASEQGSIWTYGGIRLSLYQVTDMYDDLNEEKVYDGWYSLHMDVEPNEDDCPLSVRWLSGRYELIWEPHLVIFGGSEHISSWGDDRVIVGEVPVCRNATT